MYIPGITLAGSALIPGGSAVAVSGIPVFLDPAGVLHKGSSIVPLKPQSVLTVGGQIFTANPEGFGINNTYASSGGSALTISGTPVFLDPSGMLHVGISSFFLPSHSVFTVGSQIFTANPEGFAIESSHVSRGGPALTISGTPVSLDPSQILHVGTSSIFLPPQSVFTVGSQTFTANPTGFTIGSATISPGGPVQTVGNEAISLDRAGHLHIGGSEFDVSSPQSIVSNRDVPGPSDVLTTEGLVIQPEASAIVVDGMTLSPGGPGVSIGGSSVSLERGGTLDVGSDHITVPTAGLNGTSSTMAFQGAHERRYQIRRLTLYEGALASCLLAVSM